MTEVTRPLKTSVEDLKLRLLRMRTSRERFRFPLTEGQAYTLLLASYEAEVEARHRNCILDEQTKQNISSVAKYLTSDSYKFGMLFCGFCGNGKTTMLKAFQTSCNFLHNAGKLTGELTGISIEDAVAICNTCRDNYDGFRQLCNRPMFGIEDMGKEPVEVLSFGNVQNPITDMLEYRYNEQLFTVITTNLATKDIRSRYGDRIADRFNEMFHVISFKNSTYRK